MSDFKGGYTTGFGACDREKLEAAVAAILAELDGSAPQAYNPAVDTETQTPVEAQAVSTAPAPTSRRPRSSEERARMIARLKPYSEANAAEGRKIREGRQA